MTRVSIDTKQLAGKIGDALALGARAGLLRCGLKIEKEARSRAPVDTRSLQSSIASQHTGLGLDTRVTVGPNVRSKDGAPYDVFQEFGTGIYGESPRSGWKKVTSVEGRVEGHRYKGRDVIRPRKAKHLSFKPKGSTEYVHRKFVRGVKPVRYMRDGLAAVNIEKEFVTGFNAVND